MSILVFAPNPSLVPASLDFQEFQQDTQIAAKAPQLTTYSKAEIDSLFTGFYKAVTTATKALATPQATGTQKKLITVTADESASGATKRYLYEGSGSLLGPLF